MRTGLLGFCLCLAGSVLELTGAPEGASTGVTVSRCPVERDVTANADFRLISDIEGGNAMTTSRFSVEHVRRTSERSFADVQAAFERQLGRFDPEVYKALAEGGDPAAVRARLEAMAGSSGFMLFSTSDHGRLLRIVGQQRKAVQYVIGNPLFAIEMTRHVIGASLYAPLRVLIFEADDGKTCVEYDRPSSLFGQFGNERVDRMAAALDEKLENLTAAATH